MAADANRFEPWRVLAGEMFGQRAKFLWFRLSD